MASPQLVIEELTENAIKFRLSNVSLSYANALRRVIIAEVPTLAIDFVTIRENTTPLNDEYISQRLGLIPLVSTTVESFLFSEDCGCVDQDVCPNCSVKFILKVKNNENEIMQVTSADLFQDGSRQEHQKSVKPVRYKLPNKPSEERDVLIVKLGPNQELDLECLARKGIGKNHAKFSAVCVCAMKVAPVISLKESKALGLSVDQREKLVGCCPRKVFEMDEKAKTVSVARPEECVFCLECDKFQKELNIEDLVKIEDGDYLFEIETNGALKPDEVVDSAFQQLNNKLEALKTGLNFARSAYSKF